MKRILALPLALILAAPAWAHNGMEHVMGTVAAIQGTTLDIKTGSASHKTVLTDDKTTVMRGKTALKLSDVHVNDRVVIHARPVNGKLIAAEVELGTTK